MTDAFANLVGPVFQHVVDLQARLDEGESPTLQAERDRILAVLGEAERKAGASSSQLAHDFELARRALVYWIDEVLINSGWDHAAEWKQHILEWDIYQERLRADRFYEVAHDAETLAGTDPLETFFLCVALGFRGHFADNPKALEAWAERVYNRIVAGSHQPDRFMADDSGRDAPLQPLSGKSVLLAASLLVSATALVTLACFVLAIPPWG
jgi:type VI secretion system protein ImpK